MRTDIFLVYHTGPAKEMKKCGGVPSISSPALSSPTFDGIRREDFLQQRVVIRLRLGQIDYFDFVLGNVFLPGDQFPR
jgi:hypothetical protein